MPGARVRPSPRRNPAQGLTLIELVITVAIVALLASIALPLSEVAVTRTSETELRRALREIRGALDAWKQAVDDGRIPRRAGTSGYPTSLASLVEGIEDQKSPGREKIHFLRRIPRDPFSLDTRASAEETWGLRSYASPADDPAPGEDVFDVYSLSPRTGLNGIAYREW